MKISFVIPCFRSALTIENVVEEIISVMVRINISEYEIILVNDSSPDNVIDKIKMLCEKYSFIKGIELSRNFGQHSAMMAGFAYAKGDIIIDMDDDGQLPAEDIPRFLDKLNEGYDIVIGKYPKKKHSLFRNFGTIINDFMANVLINKPKDIFFSSYVAMRAYVVGEMLRYNNPYPYLAGLMLRSTNRITNIDVTHKERVKGKSGYTLLKLLSLWMNGFTAFSVKPLRLATFTGVICATIGFIFGIYTVIHKLVNPSTSAGWSSIMAVLLFIGGTVMLMLGLIGEYIGRIYICLNNSPQYVIRETVNIETSIDTLKRT